MEEAAGLGQWVRTAGLTYLLDPIWGIVETPQMGLVGGLVSWS
jgi:hypothetical protein